MILHDLPGAPNPTKVRLYIAEKKALGVQMDLDIRTVNVYKKANRTPEYLALNPFGTMPVLELSDGVAIFESLPIIDYLEECYPAPSLWGNDRVTRGVSRTLERVADVRLLNPTATYVHAVNSPIGITPDPAVAEHARSGFVRAFEYFDHLLADGRPFLAGDHVTVADCTLQAALQFMRFRELEDLSSYPRLERWSGAYRERAPAREVLKF